jgi:hypothetical protein
MTNLMGATSRGTRWWRLWFVGPAPPRLACCRETRRSRCDLVQFGELLLNAVGVGGTVRSVEVERLLPGLARLCVLLQRGVGQSKMI